MDNATIGGGSDPDHQVGSVTITASTTAAVEAQSWAVAAGVGEVGINNATAIADPTVQAYVGNDAAVTVTGSVGLTSDAETGASTNVFGASLGVLTAGLNESTATDSPTVATYVGAGSSIRAGGTISLASAHNTTGGSGASASAEAPGAAVVGYDGATATATANADVSSSVSPGGTLQAAGTIAITANSNNDATSEAFSAFLGVLGVGLSQPTSNVTATTAADMDGAVLGGTGLTISSQSSNLGTASAQAGSLGAVGIAGAITNATVTPQTTASIGDDSTGASVLVSGNVGVTAQSVDNADAQSFGVIAGLVAGGVVDTTSTLDPTVNTLLGQDSSVTSTGGSVTLEALHNYSPDGSVVGGYGATAGAGGAGGGVVYAKKTQANATANADVQTLVDAGATVNASQDVTLMSLSDNSASSSATSDTLGVVALGEISAAATALGSTQAQLAGINGLVAGGNLTVLAQGTNASSTYSQAASGGVFNLDGSDSTSMNSPTVGASLDGAGPVTVVGNTAIAALALGNSSADAEGLQISLGNAGSSEAEAFWTPVVDANIGGFTDLKSGGNVSIDAFDNFDQAGNADTSRQVNAKATSTGGGIFNLEAAGIGLVVNSQVSAHIGVGASVAAGNDLIIDSEALNQAVGTVDGTAYGIGNAGSTNASVTMASQTLAYTDDASAFDPTVLRAGSLVLILSNTDDNGNVNANASGGGVVNFGGVYVILQLNNPRTESYLGNDTTVYAPGAALQIIAQNQNNLSGYAHQSAIAVIGSNQAETTAQVTNSQTFAYVGADVQATVGQFLLSATDQSLQAYANADAEIPAGVGGDNEADSEADEGAIAEAYIGPGSGISSATTLDIVAATDSVNTTSIATTYMFGFWGDLTSNSTGNLNVNDYVDAEPGSQLTGGSVSITADQPQSVTLNVDPNTNNYTICFFCDSTNAYGSENISNSVALNSNISITGTVAADLVVDPTGKVVQLQNLVATDGVNSLAVGETIGTGQIDVTSLLDGPGSNLVVSAPGGTTSGSSSVVFDDNATVTILNESTNDLYLDTLDVLDYSAAPSVVDSANAAGWNFDIATVAGGGVVNVANTNPAGGNIDLQGQIINPDGTTVIRASGGNVLADSPGALIQTAVVDLESATGTLGTVSRPLPLQMVFSPGLPAAIEQAVGQAGVYLDVTSESQSSLGLDLAVDNVQSGGDVNLLFEDGEIEGAAAGSAILLHSIRSSGGNVIVVAGTSLSVPTDIYLQDQIVSPNGTTSVTTLAGNIFDGSSDQLISARDITLTAAGGTIGLAGEPIQTDLGAGHLNAAAQEDVQVVNDGALLDIGTVTSSAGNIVLVASNSNAPGGDMALDPSSNISAPNGAVTLSAGENVFISSGSTIQAFGLVSVSGDENDVGQWPGSTLDVFGTILAASAQIFGSKPGEVFNLARPDTTPTSVFTDGGDAQVNVLATAGPLTVYTGPGGDTVNVGSLAPLPGGVLDGIGGTLTVHGDGAADLLNIDDSGSTADEAGVLTSSTLTGLGMAGTIAYQDVGTVQVALGQGTDTLTVASTQTGSTIVQGGPGTDTFNVQSTAGPTTIQGGSGTDTFNVQSIGAAMTILGDGQDTVNVGSLAPLPGGVLDGIGGTLTVHGDGAADLLNIDDSGSTADEAGVLTSSTLTGLGMAGTIAYQDVGTVQVALGQGTDTLTVASTQTGSTIVQGGPGTDTFNVQSTAGPTTIQGGTGTDTFNVQSTASPTTLIGGSGTDTFNIQSIGAAMTILGDGQDTVNVGSLAPLPGGVLDGIGGTLTVHGDGAADLLNIDDSGSTADEAGVLTSSTLTGLGMAGTIAYQDVGTVQVALGQGTDTLTIASTQTGSTIVQGGPGTDTFNVQSIAGPTTIQGGTGTDTFNVGSLAPLPGGVLSGIGGTLTVHGDGAADLLNIDDSGSTADEAGVLTSSTLTGLGMAGTIAYQDVGTVQVALGQGTDTLTIASTQTGSTIVQGGPGTDTFNVQSIAGPTTIQGGTGTDTFNVGSLAPLPGGVLDGIGGTLTVHGDGAADLLNIDDSGSTADEAGVLTSSTLTGLGMAGTITYQDVGTVQVTLGRGNDTLTVVGTQTGSTVVRDGLGNETVNVQSIAGPTTLIGGSGSDIFNVGSLTPLSGGNLLGIDAPSSLTATEVET